MSSSAGTPLIYLLARVRHRELRTGLRATGARIRHFQGRWAFCDANNVVASSKATPRNS